MMFHGRFKKPNTPGLERTLVLWIALLQIWKANPHALSKSMWLTNHPCLKIVSWFQMFPKLDAESPGKPLKTTEDYQLNISSKNLPHSQTLGLFMGSPLEQPMILVI